MVNEIIIFAILVMASIFLFATGKVNLKEREDWEIYLQPSDQQKVFQSIKGWIMVKKTYRGEHLKVDIYFLLL